MEKYKYNSWKDFFEDDGWHGLALTIFILIIILGGRIIYEVLKKTIK